MTTHQAVNVRQLLDLTGRVAMITGGSMGWGARWRKASRKWRKPGALRRKKERCERAAEELKALGVATVALACDVTNPASIRDVVEAAITRFGRIDIFDQQRGNFLGSSRGRNASGAMEQGLETNLTARSYVRRPWARS